jgi:hypothetical protein
MTLTFISNVINFYSDFKFKTVYIFHKTTFASIVSRPKIGLHKKSNLWKQDKIQKEDHHKYFQRILRG